VKDQMKGISLQATLRDDILLMIGDETGGKAESVEQNCE